MVRIVTRRVGRVPVRWTVRLTAPRRVSEDESMLTRAIPACCLMFVLLRCGGRDETHLSDLSLSTFNAAIGVGLAPYADQRLPAIEGALASLDADVVCLQELWEAADIERVTEALRGEFPHSHRSVRSSAETAAGCTDSEATLLLTCLEENCANVETAGLPLCAIRNCADDFTLVSMGCQECVIANQSASDVGSLIANCATDDGEAARYENQTGLLLLSKLPLSGLDFLELESTLGDRGVLAARVQTSLVGSVDVYCTHLAASLNEVPYMGPYGSWQGERVVQISHFLEWVDATRAPGGAAVLLGDMNCGPETARARSASPDAFARFVDAGFEDPYAELDGRCTFCSSNPLNGFATDVDQGALIDHVLLSGFEAFESRTASRIFDDPIEISADGLAVTTARSDHYGVQVNVSAAEPEP